MMPLVFIRCRTRGDPGRLIKPNGLGPPDRIPRRSLCGVFTGSDGNPSVGYARLALSPQVSAPLGAACAPVHDGRTAERRSATVEGAIGSELVAQRRFLREHGGRWPCQRLPWRGGKLYLKYDCGLGKKLLRARPSPRTARAGSPEADADEAYIMIRRQKQRRIHRLGPRPVRVRCQRCWSTSARRIFEGGAGLAGRQLPCLALPRTSVADETASMATRRLDPT
jgi:hypothetical protein